MSSSRRSRSVRVPAELHHRLAQLTRARVDVVVVTVYHASGSAPGKAGAKMLVTRDALHGTVGGGRVENAALLRARDLLGSETGPVTERYDVVQDLGMSCGGTMQVLFEPMTPAPRLVVFGAGHIAEPLCAMAVLAGFDVTICDIREDWLTEARFPDAERRLAPDWPQAVAGAELSPRTLVASVSPGHAVDAQVVRTIHGSGVRPRYLGVIGSQRKAITLKQELTEAGLDAAFVEDIRIPMGLDIGAADPREIAVSIVAELVSVVRAPSRP